MDLLSGIENDVKSDWESGKRAAGDLEHAGESAWNDAVAAAKQAGRQLSDPNSLTSQLGHTALDTIGMVPVAGSVAEAANAGWYAAQGDPIDAALSGASAIPVVGDPADAARLTKDGIDIARDGETVAHDAHGAEKIVKDAGEGEAARPQGPATKPPDAGRPGGGGGDAGGPPSVSDGADGEYPIGLAYGRDLRQHLAGTNRSISRGALQGTHNLDNAKSALESRGAYQVRALENNKPGYTLTPTDTDGLWELHYQIPTRTTGRIKEHSKTVYDPAVHSDQSMLQWALKAGEEAFRRYKADPSKTVFDVKQDGMMFRAYIKIHRPTGAPYVANVHPITR